MTNEKNRKRIHTTRRRFDRLALSFIDAHVDLFGSIQSNHVQDALGLSRVAVSKYFKLYKTEKPSNLQYDITDRCYKKGFSFERRFLVKVPSAEILKMVDTLYRGHPSNDDLICLFAEAKLAETGRVSTRDINNSVGSHRTTISQAMAKYNENGNAIYNPDSNARCFEKTEMFKKVKLTDEQTPRDVLKAFEVLFN
ncbi:hypothetical protein [Vibrio owensii]|uniref:hypothetical protein n=1 Tax=Vibrio owensii TaxID=696485 RepID=UPI004067CC81